MIDLRTIRNNSDKTQKEIAHEVGITRAFYSNIEKGIRRPSPEVAQRIAKTLNFDWTLFYSEGDKS